MRFRTYTYTNSGARANNEDALLAKEGIWVLADGLGGHDCGEVASAETVQHVLSVWTESGKPVDKSSMMDMLDSANANLLALQQTNSRYAAMRTTLVYAVTDGKQLSYANVGDSRFYFFRNGRVVLQSEDHSVPAALAKIGQIKYEEIRNHEDRNKLLKVIGNSENLNLRQIPDAIQLCPGDAFLLCSDGFWEYIYEQEMEIDLAKSTDPKDWMGFMVKRILLKTENKDNDNFSAICVMVSDNV